MPINVNFNGSTIFAPGGYLPPKDDCRLCSDRVFKFLLKEKLCEQCADKVWKTILDEEDDASRAQEALGPITEAL